MATTKDWLYANSYKLIVGLMAIIISGAVLITSTTSDVESNTTAIKANTTSIEKLDGKLDEALASLSRIEGRLSKP